ncbi:hypothetical protein IFM89_002833 [Coptis chinensis]|uniref:Uncharacterized protein n=1 Tax=Coptis chinensis TaxID=261450 RepID=A0A835I0P7_9MAGN|nr:hypothetical protein IFM89_002833 [Coptis chinensis]
MGPGRRTTRSSNAQPPPQPSSQSADASLGVMESGGRTLPQSRPNVYVGLSSGPGAAERQAEEYERQAQELTTRLHENEGRCPAQFIGLLAYQALARCSCSPPSGRSARYPYYSLCSPPPPSHCSSHKLWQLQLAPTGMPCEARVGSPGHPYSIPLRVFFAFAGSREILRVFRPIFHCRAIRFIGTTKSLMLTLSFIDVSIISNHEDPGHASSFHSHHHIDDKSPGALP